MGCVDANRRAFFDEVGDLVRCASVVVAVYMRACCTLLENGRHTTHESAAPLKSGMP